MVISEHAFSIYVDHHQFYLHDAAPDVDFDFSFDDLDAAVEEHQTHQALMISTRRAVGYASVIVEIHDKRPDLAFDEWDHIVECSLRVRSAAIRVSAPWDDDQPPQSLANGQYAALICFGDTDTAPYDDEWGADHYRAQLWPGPHRPVTVLKRSTIVEDDPLEDRPPYAPTQSIEQLASRLRNGGTSEALHAAVTLCRIGSPDALAALRPALEDTRVSVPRIAASALFLSGGRGVPLLITLLRHPDAQTRIRATQALGQVAEASTLIPLVEALADPDAQVRYWAGRNLGRIAQPDTLPLLLPLLRDARAETRRAAVQALSELGQWSLGFAALGAVAPALIPLLSDPDPDGRERAISVLGDILKARPDLTPPTDLLLARLHDGDWNERESAARALGQTRDQRAVDPLIAALRDDHFRVQTQAALALGELGDPRAIPALIELTRSESPDLRRCAQTALDALGGAS